MDHAGDANRTATYAHGYKAHAKLKIGRGQTGKGHKAAQQQYNPTDDRDNVFHLSPALFESGSLASKRGKSNDNRVEPSPMSNAMDDLIALASGFFLGVGITLFGLSMVFASMGGGS